MAHQQKLVGLFISFWFIASTGVASAAEAVGVITQAEGDVKIFSHPSKTLQAGDGVHALFEGEYYLVRAAQAGGKVEQGNIVRTAPGGKARLVYENGDQFNIGPGTAMRVFLAGKPGIGAESSRIDLAYGKLRGVVEKGGPRSRLQIRTRSATMGVRGTDFFIAGDGKDGGTEVSVLRGSVEVLAKSDAAKGAKPLEVTQGYSAEVPAAAGTVKPLPLEIRKTTQEELQGIQKSSTLEKKPAEAPPLPAIAKLEQKAVQTALKDIQVYDPELFSKLDTRKVATTDELNGKVVSQLIQVAPKAPDRRKPFKSEIEDLERGAYDKYFKQPE